MTGFVSIVTSEYSSIPSFWSGGSTVEARRKNSLQDRMEKQRGEKGRVRGRRRERGGRRRERGGKEEGGRGRRRGV